MVTRVQKAMKEKDGGFTLVELIVVVVVVGVLAAIAVPVFFKQPADAKIKADLAVLSVAKIAMEAYTSDKGSAALKAPPTSALTPYGFPASPVMTVTDVDGPNGYFVVKLEAADGTVTGQSGKHCSAWVNAAYNTLECAAW